MSSTGPTLHMLCGKIAAGKSTLARRLAEANRTVLISEDAWLDALFADQMGSVQDYVRCAAKLRTIMGSHVVRLLNTGVSVVLDFPANTVETRAWMRGILQQSDAKHVLHVLDPSDAVCLARLAARNATAEHPFVVTEAQYHQVVRHIVMPSAEEGFTIQRHDAAVSSG